MNTRQQELNYELYLAAHNNDINKVKHYLQLGAKVVDIKHNGTFDSAWSTITYYYQKGGYASKKKYYEDDLTITMDVSNALGYAISHQNPYMTALLSQNARSHEQQGLITADYIYCANRLDTETRSQYKYQVLSALSDPEAYLQPMQQQTADALRREEDKKRRGKEEWNQNHPFDVVKLADVQFKSKSNGIVLMNDVNATIARIYQRAEDLFNSSHVWTVGKKDKAQALLTKLTYLTNAYNNSGTVPSAVEYLNSEANGKTLGEVLQEKRVPNPFTTFASSWNQLTKQMPTVVAPPPAYQKTL